MTYIYRYDAVRLSAQEEPVGVVQLEQKKSPPPPFYQVVMLNDDFTPMDFVIEMLRVHFGKCQEEATVIMLSIHHKGRGVCGVYSRDIAQTKIELVMGAAQRAQHPLQCIMEVL